MRSMILLVVGIHAFAAVPASADATAPVAATAMACAAAAPLALAATPDRPQPDDSCTAEVTCYTSGGGSYNLSCTGASTCSTGAYKVTCDGQQHLCSCWSTAYCGNTCICSCYEVGGTSTECHAECCG